MTKSILILALAAVLSAVAAEAREAGGAGGLHAPGIIIRIDHPTYDERGSSLM